MENGNQIILKVNICLTLLFLLCTAQFCHGQTQNLVPNGDFEDYVNCPTRFADFENYVNDWFSSNKSSPDYYNTCAKKYSGVNPKNALAGPQTPYSKNGYIGIVIHSDEYREYIQCKLKEPLLKGKLYCMTMQVSLAEGSNFSTNRLGGYLSRKKISQNNQVVLKINKHQLENKESLFIENCSEWTKLCFTYKVTEENLKYLTIGNFYGRNETDLKKNNYKPIFKIKFKKEDNTYIYIDDVSLIAINDSSSCVCNSVQPIVTPQDSSINKVVPLIKDSIIVGKPIVLQNVFFDNNKAVVLPTSHTELDKLYTYLNQNAALHIVINGYTDNVGKEVDNLSLSSARAKAVANYLTNKGIVSTRISYKGYGSSNALNDNSTEVYKAINRRVEFVVE